MLWAALALVPITALLTQYAERPPAAKGLDAPVSEFSALRARAVLQGLLGEPTPHPLGSAANAQLRARIVRQFEQLGYRAELQSNFMACDARGGCGIPTNIIARLPGTAGDESAVVLSAHYDSVAAGPGASDDGAGVAAALEIARILRLGAPPRHSVIFLIDDGEEAGLLGAQVFVRHHRWARSVQADVNLEARGTSGPSYMFETGTANRWLMGLYSAVEARPIANSIYYTAYRAMPNDTDFTVFKAAGWEGFNFAFIDGVSRYHTSLDDWRHADARSIQDQGERALAALRGLADADPARARAGQAEYFDVLGRVLVRIGVPTMRGLTLAALGTALLLIGGLAHRGSLSWRELRSSCALLIGAPWLAGALAWLLLQLLSRRLSNGALSVVAHPWAPELAFLAAAFALLGALAASVRGRAGPLVWPAATVLWGLTAASALAWLVPGMSYLLFWPALIALAALGIAVVATKEADAAVSWASLLHGAAALLLMWPLILPLYSALGAVGLVLEVAVVVLLGGGLVGLIAAAPAADRRLTIGLGITGCLAGGIATLWLPRFSAETPRRLDLAYTLDADRAQGQWLLDARTGRPPPAWSQLRPVTLDPSAAPLPPPFGAALGTGAPTLALAPPLLALTSQTEQAALAPRAYELHLRSARGAPKLWLALPASAQIRLLMLSPGAQWDADLAASLVVGRARAGWFMVSLQALPPEGATVRFVSAAPQFDLGLIDESYGLPQAGQWLQRQRPSDSVPSQDGDVTLVGRTFHLAAGALAGSSTR
jgi:Peptidase family M28